MGYCRQICFPLDTHVSDIAARRPDRVVDGIGQLLKRKLWNLSVFLKIHGITTWSHTSEILEV